MTKNPDSLEIGTHSTSLVHFLLFKPTRVCVQYLPRKTQIYKHQFAHVVIFLISRHGKGYLVLGLMRIRNRKVRTAVRQGGN